MLATVPATPSTLNASNSASAAAYKTRPEGASTWRSGSLESWVDPARLNPPVLRLIRRDIARESNGFCVEYSGAVVVVAKTNSPDGDRERFVGDAGKGKGEPGIGRSVPFCGMMMNAEIEFDNRLATKMASLPATGAGVAVGRGAAFGSAAEFGSDLEAPPVHAASAINSAAKTDTAKL
jgi:hypothetical protein